MKKMASMAHLSNNDVQQFMEEHRKDMAVYNGTTKLCTISMLSCYNHGAYVAIQWRLVVKQW